MGRGSPEVRHICLATNYLPEAFVFGPRLWTEFFPSTTLRFGFFPQSAGSSSPCRGGLPLPARPRIRKVSARSDRRALSRKYSSVRKAEIFSATATLMSWFRATPSNSAVLRNSSSKEGWSRSAKLLRLMIQLLIHCNAVAGRMTAQSKLFVTDAKSLRLNVTIALALPLIAVSRTMSSFGSDSLGRQRNASRTGLATATTSSRTDPTSSESNPHAAKCSGLVSTDSYSRIKGTESSKSNCRFKAANKSSRDAPVSLRKAATITSVSKTKETDTRIYDIACNIMSQMRARVISFPPKKRPGYHPSLFSRRTDE